MEEYLKQVRNTLSDLEGKLSNANIDDSQTCQSIRNSRNAIDEIEKSIEFSRDWKNALECIHGMMYEMIRDNKKIDRDDLRSVCLSIGNLWDFKTQQIKLIREATNLIRLN